MRYALYSLLPMSVLNETGVKVKIRHSDSIHSGVCGSSEGNCSVSRYNISTGTPMQYYVYIVNVPKYL